MEGTDMIAREKWQINTIKALELVFEERVAQTAKHGDAMRHLPDGTGPDERWLKCLAKDPITGEYPSRNPDGSAHYGASTLQQVLRSDYEDASDRGELTRMHLVREELAEAFELDGDDPAFLEEICQVAALCVQWMEYKLEEVTV